MFTATPPEKDWGVYSCKMAKWWPMHLANCDNMREIILLMIWNWPQWCML